MKRQAKEDMKRKAEAVETKKNSICHGAGCEKSGDRGA